MSLTPPRYTPADYLEEARAVEAGGEAYLALMLQQSASMARVLDRLRETLERFDVHGAEHYHLGKQDGLQFALDTLARLLREEGVTPTP